MKKTTGMVLFISVVFLSILTLIGCESSTPIIEITKDGLKYEGYGTIYGLNRVCVYENEHVIADISLGNIKKSEPYSANDGLNYGMNIADIDDDGIYDIVVQTSRKKGSETYEIYLGSDGEFTKITELSNVTGVLFTDGHVYRHTHKKLYYVRGIKDAPDVYDEYDSKVLFGRDEYGKFHEISEERLTYYSDTDMYCFSTYKWDNNSKTLESDEDLWIKPEKLNDYGFEPFS